jgi:hypothetical protein
MERAGGSEKESAAAAPARMMPMTVGCLSDPVQTGGAHAELIGWIEWPTEPTGWIVILVPRLARVQVLDRSVRRTYTFDLSFLYSNMHAK